VGLILPHEHIFVDMRTPDQVGYAQVDKVEVINLMGPELERARQSGVTAIVEATPVGVGRRVDLIKAVSEASGFPVVVPTGVYREPWIPDWIHEAQEDALVKWMLSELDGEIESSGIQAGWIKLSAGDDGLTTTETKVLNAAATAAIQSASGGQGPVIGSHTVRGHVVHDQLTIIEQAGYKKERFIWIHAQIEPDFDMNMEVAWSGAWIEYDALGDDIYSDIIFERVLKMLDAGLGDQILLSHDRGWFDPAQPGGGTPRPFTYLTETFLPKLRSEGVDENTIYQITHRNPFNAFARLVS
jgi:phosphotriesterase-related protein